MKPLTLTLLRTPRMVAMLSLAALACCGCRSLNQPASASFASVVIAIRSVDEIRRVTGAVFLEAGYSGLTNASGGMVFEKEGTRKHQIAYGGLADDSPVRERVRAEIVQLLDGTQRLECKAYIVRHAGDSFFEEEVRLANSRSGPYQRLLDEVLQRLK